MILIGEVIQTVAVPDKLVWREAEVTTHPRAGYTIKVPVRGTATCLYLGQWESERAAGIALAYRQCH